MYRLVLCFSLLSGVFIFVGCSRSVPPAAVILPTIPPTIEAPASPPPTATPLPPPTATPTAQPTLDAALLAQGETVYKTMYCGTCHTLDALGTLGSFGPAHNNMAFVAEQRIQTAEYTGKATNAAEYIRESIVEPEVYLIADYVTSRHKMPKYTFLPPSDIDALVYLLSQQTTQ